VSNPKNVSAEGSIVAAVANINNAVRSFNTAGGHFVNAVRNIETAVGNIVNAIERI
jgi:hypothetical protein